MISTGSVNGVRQTGFGIPNAINTGCYMTTLNSFTGGTNNCASINRQVSGVTAGFWQDLYKGNFGRVAAGFEWEWIRRESFPGTRSDHALVRTAQRSGRPPGQVGRVWSAREAH
jgi:hypothetical protein